MSLLDRLRTGTRFVRAFGGVLAEAARYGHERNADFSDLIAGHFAAQADRPALIGESSHMTWRELDDFANRVAGWARAEGLGRGDVVALLMENRPEFVAIWLGLSRVGVIAALQNTNLTGDRLAHCLREASTRHWIVGAELAPAAASAVPEFDPAPQILIASHPGGEGPDAAALDELLPEATSFDAAIAARPADPVPPALRADRRGGDGLFLIYTSGTTGLPKAARISHTKAIMTGLAACRFQGLGPDDRVYICLPLYHSAGGMMAAGAGLISGGALVIARRFSARGFWSDCVQHDVTAFQYIGELCRYLLNSPPHPEERAHKIRVALGNGLRPEVWQPFQERFGIPRIIEFYGATEGNTALFNLEGRVGAVGYVPAFLRPVLGLEILEYDIEADDLVRDDAGRVVRARIGEPGELVIRISKTARFEGYTNEQASEKKVLRNAFKDGDAYFRTGDLLRMDEDGFYYFVDRIGDTFRWKGENVSTNEVAEVLSVVAGVEEANVYGVEVPGADGRAGMAALVTNGDFDLEAFGHVVERELAFYARPLFVRILPRMDTTGTFKHRKVDLVKEGFDPVAIDDPIFFRDPEKQSYVPLDTITHDRIVRGEIRV